MVRRLLASMRLPYSLQEPMGWHYSYQLAAVWVAVMCVMLGASIGGRPSSAHSVTPLTTLLSLSDPVTKAESDRYRQGENVHETERVGGISF